MTSGLTTSRPPSAEHRPTVAWLRDTRVRVLGSSPALEVAGRVLAQLGAQVVVDEAGAGDPAADVVLVDRIERPTGVPGRDAPTAAEYLEYVAGTNRSVWVTASAYGLSTRRADAYGSDLSVLAAGGILGHSRIGDEWAPIVPPGTLGLKLVGYVMAVAALHGLHTLRAQGQPVHVDVSAQGAVIATGLTLEMAHALADCPDEGGSARYGAPSGFFDCLDGAVYVLVLEEHQWDAFRRTLSPALDDVATLEDARRRADDVNARLTEWAATRTAEECEQVLQAAGVPCTAVNSVTRFAERAQEAGRSVDLTGEGTPVLPAQITEAPGKRAADRAKSVIPLADLRVLDAGHVLAVPLAAAWLGAMGADVTKLEDPGRLDIYRRRGPFADGVPGLNRSAYFNQLNFCKQTLDVEVGRLGAALDVGAFDIVLTNLTPRRAKVVGVDGNSVLAAETPTLSLTSSGFGGTGAWSHYRAYGHNIHAFAGLVSATRDARGEMGDMGTPWADPLTSVALAAWTLAWSLAPERDSSAAVDVSMGELTAAQLTDLAGVDPAEAYRAPAVGGDFFVRLRDSRRMVAVSLRDADEVARFEAIVGRPLPPITTKGELADVGPLDREDLPELLLAEGFRVSEVLTAHDLARDVFVRSTGLFQPVDSTALGRYDVTGLPWQFVGQEPAALRAAPERPGTGTPKSSHAA